jgi:hypothetical protein
MVIAPPGSPGAAACWRSRPRWTNALSNARRQPQATTRRPSATTAKHAPAAAASCASSRHCPGRRHIPPRGEDDTDMRSPDHPPCGGTLARLPRVPRSRCTAMTRSDLFRPVARGALHPRAVAAVPPVTQPTPSARPRSDAPGRATAPTIPHTFPIAPTLPAPSFNPASMRRRRPSCARSAPRRASQNPPDSDLTRSAIPI